MVWFGRDIECCKKHCRRCGQFIMWKNFMERLEHIGMVLCSQLPAVYKNLCINSVTLSNRLQIKKLSRCKSSVCAMCTKFLDVLRHSDLKSLFFLCPQDHWSYHAALFLSDVSFSISHFTIKLTTHYDNTTLRLFCSSAW